MAMDAFLALLFSYPTAIFSVAMGMAVLYWLMVILGALDLDVIHFGDGGDADHDADAGSNPNAVLEFLRVGKVPLTIIVSTFTFIGWSVCLVAGGFLRPLVPGWSWWLFGTAALAGAIFLAMLGTGFLLAPIAKLFSAARQPSADDLIGKLVEVTSSTVDARFGTARHDRLNGEDVLLNVICEAHHHLRRGNQAVVMSYDAATGVCLIAPLPHTQPGFLPEPRAEQPSGAPPAPPTSNAQ